MAVKAVLNVKNSELTNRCKEVFAMAINRNETKQIKIREDRVITGQLGPYTFTEKYYEYEWWNRSKEDLPMSSSDYGCLQHPAVQTAVRDYCVVYKILDLEQGIVEVIGFFDQYSASEEWLRIEMERFITEYERDQI